MNRNEPQSQDGPSSLAQEAIRRSLSRRQDAAENDVRRMIEVGRNLLSSGRNPRVADIVEAAGLSNDAFYRYFRSKEDFVAAVVEDGGNRLVAYMERKMADHDSADAKIIAALEAIMSQAGDPGVASATRNILANSTGHHQRESGARTRLELSMMKLLSGPLAQLKSADPERDGRAVAALIMGVMENFLWSETPPSKKDLSHLSGFIRNAITATT